METSAIDGSAPHADAATRGRRTNRQLQSAVVITPGMAALQHPVPRQLSHATIQPDGISASAVTVTELTTTTAAVGTGADATVIGTSGSASRLPNVISTSLRSVQSVHSGALTPQLSLFSGLSLDASRRTVGLPSHQSANAQPQQHRSQPPSALRLTPHQSRMSNSSTSDGGGGSGSSQDGYRSPSKRRVSISETINAEGAGAVSVGSSRSSGLVLGGAGSISTLHGGRSQASGVHVAGASAPASFHYSASRNVSFNNRSEAGYEQRATTITEADTVDLDTATTAATMHTQAMAAMNFASTMHSLGHAGTMVDHEGASVDINGGDRYNDDQSLAGIVVTAAGAQLTAAENITGLVAQVNSGRGLIRT